MIGFYGADVFLLVGLLTAGGVVALQALRWVFRSRLPPVATGLVDRDGGVYRRPADAGPPTGHRRARPEGDLVAAPGSASGEDAA